MPSSNPPLLDKFLQLRHHEIDIESESVSYVTGVGATVFLKVGENFLFRFLRRNFAKLNGNRTVAKVDSIGFVVRKCPQCSAGKS